MLKLTDEVELLLWCMRPALDLCHLRGELPDRITRSPITKRFFRPANHTLFREYFVVTETVNQARALDRLVGTASEEIPVVAPSPQEREPILTAAAVNGALERIIAPLSQRVSAPVVSSFENQLYKVALALAQYRAMDLTRYTGVLVSTQHSPIIRALFVAAAEQSVPVVYIPHAPVAANNAYLDLPVAYAGLRGRGERDYYGSELSIDTAALDLVGNLASDVLSTSLPAIRAEGRGVLALSPHAEDTIRRIFDAVSSPGFGLGPGEVVIAPHPRSNLNEIRAQMPAGWELREGERTLDILKEGAPFIFQFSSGVAWESAALGIPTATVRVDDAPVNYPFLSNESIYPSIRTPNDAVAFSDRARSGGVDRTALRAHAEHWCGIDGDAAARALAALLDRIAHSDTRRSEMLHDGWSSGGGALERSWLSTTTIAP